MISGAAEAYENGFRRVSTQDRMTAGYSNARLLFFMHAMPIMKAGKMGGDNMKETLGGMIFRRRKALGLTQRELAERLHLSFQAVSKWESGVSAPDIALLPELARQLQTSVDALLGFAPEDMTAYDEKYRGEDYYWGLEPNRLCYELMRRLPPVKPLHVLELGCGEGKDAVFFAKNGYRVTALDLSERGLEKARSLAERHRVDIHFVKGDINSLSLREGYDIVFSSGVLHYLAPENRGPIMNMLKIHTSPGGLHALNVFVHKPFLSPAPDLEEAERQVAPWYSGELNRHYADWLLHQTEEVIFDCCSGGIPHRHCMNVLIAEKPIES